MSNLAGAVILSLVFIRGAHAVGGAFGYATSTTGGGSATPAVPKSTSELISWLGDSTPRSILLDKIFDFTDTEGSVTGTVCSPWSCSPNPQQMLDNASGSNCATTPKSTGTWKKAGTSAIKVGSNKTLLGKGSAGGIKGKGLQISGVSNVIIQNIRISDINARYVWGGDAILVDNSSKVWIDHNYFQNVGRQFIVTGFGAANGVTISNNIFDGTATYSTGCDGHHYWVFLFAGNGDKITLAKNYIHTTAGRGPHIGGMPNYDLALHAYNNYFSDISGHALDADTSSKTLFEGNYFASVKTPVTTNTNGAAYVPTTSAHASSCSAYIGRNCAVNTFASSGSVNRVDAGALPTFQSVTTVKSTSVLDASQVPSYVQANAGLGKIN